MKGGHFALYRGKRKFLREHICKLAMANCFLIVEPKFGQYNLLILGNSNIIFNNQPNFRVVLKARYNNETMALLDSREGSCIEYKLSGGKLCNKRGTQVWSAQSATWSSLWRQSFDTRHSLLDALNRSHQICPYSCQKPFFPAALNHCLLNDWLNSISTLALRNLFGSYICVDA